MAPVAKRVRAAGLLLTATLGLLLSSAPSLAGEHCPRTYRVGVSQIGYSYYLLDDGTPAGSSFDFYAELARRSGCTFEIDPLPRARAWHEAKLQHLDIAGLSVMADLIVKSVFATLPDIIDPPAEALPEHLTPQAKITQQLRFIFIGLKHWQGLGSTE